MGGLTPRRRLRAGPTGRSESIARLQGYPTFGE
jgi:hypothetical protein